MLAQTRFIGVGGFWGGFLLHGQLAHLYVKRFLRDFGTVISRVSLLPCRFAKITGKLPINKVARDMPQTKLEST